MKTVVIDLERKNSVDKKKETENGFIISLWKNWEEILPFEPEQVYLNVCYPGQIKGPHLHMQRTQQYACIQGKGRIIIRYEHGDYETIEIDADEKPAVVIVPAGTPSAIQNTGNSDFVLINMPNPAWHPENQDDHPVEFNDFTWKK